MNDNLQKNLFQSERSMLLESIQSEFLGPLEGDEKLTENPVTRYASGMIFPNHYENRRNIQETADHSLDSENEAVVIEEVNIENPETGSSNSFYPSVLGLSFFCSGDNPELVVEAFWTIYQKMDSEKTYVEIESLPTSILEHEDFKQNFEYLEGKLYPKGAFEKKVVYNLTKDLEDKELRALFYKAYEQAQGTWKNIRDTAKIVINPDFKSTKITEGLDLMCNRKHIDKIGLTLFTFALKNTQPACDKGMDEGHVFFNVSLNVTSVSTKKDIFVEYIIPPQFEKDEEELSLRLLYRNRKTYAVGHGCAADWKCNEESKVESIFTKAIPTYEVPKTDFAIKGLNTSILSMRILSGSGNRKENEIISELKIFCEYYNSWINSIQSDNSIPDQLKDTAIKHIELCKESYNRMLGGIEILSNDKRVMQAFKLANQSMLMQSLHSDFQKRKRLPGEGLLEFPDYSKEEIGKGMWRPFQLAFLLLSIKGITDTNSFDRSLVDLVWFPTGGGKTEAYLGLTAFTIFLRKLRNPNASNGTTVMMRYTLRLLTAQQFQRACTLICAMEKIRRENPSLLGKDEISIGMWVGLSSTPNELDKAEEKFENFKTGRGKNPSPILKCPWCGTQMITGPENNKKLGYCQKGNPKQANLFCLEKECEFRYRLPILIVDEEIYRDAPSLLFGTVDKFAQMPMKKGIAKIFAADPDNPNMPPELIIQDELHLISGALGTLVGIYETAIDYLCSKKGVRPKIIASTATIRRASEQCKSLFSREMRQFPAFGIDISDSFFAKDTPTEEAPGRLYVGLMPSGKTQTTASVRLSAKLLYSEYNSESDDEIRDKYWTLVTYFNSIRELGGFISLANDDIPFYQNTLKQRYHGSLRHFYTQELTSRMRAEEIPDILDRLLLSFKERGSIPVLAATNMISVGVDIDRLSLMVIRGQPKLTSEYIQVSSRIGRKYPGMAIVLYNSARTRDRAHYERFRTYHESVYRNVEPSSVTPFSAPARTRALGAILITMFRHGLGREYDLEDGASKFNLKLPELKVIKDFIYDRVKMVDKEEADATMEELDALFKEWELYTLENNSKVVYTNEQQGAPMKKKPETLGKGLWVLPTSMRNVDAECNINVIDE